MGVCRTAAPHRVCRWTLRDKSILRGFRSVCAHLVTYSYGSRFAAVHAGFAGRAATMALPGWVIQKLQNSREFSALAGPGEQHPVQVIAVVAGACSRRAARVGSRHVRGSSRADLSRWRGGGECVRFLARSRRGGPRDRTPRPTWGRARSSRADSCSGSEWAAYRRHESTWRKGLVRENLRSAPLRFSLTLSIPRRTHGGGWVEGGRVCVFVFGMTNSRCSCGCFVAAVATDAATIGSG